ncbi:hypothetical protein LCGC14_3018030, partial [marine sediment metagenome]
TLLDAKKGKVQYGDVIVTRVFELAYTDTTSAKNLLDAMKLGVNINPIEATGTLVVIGYAYRMPRIEQLLEMIDRPGEPKQFRFRQLKYTMAKTLAPKIKTLAEQLGTISITIAAPAAPAPARPARGRPPARPAPPPAALAKPTVYLDADERTNRILMIGLEEQLALIDEFIKVTDSESAHTAREISNTEGIFAGYTSGAVMQAIKQLNERGEFGADDNVVVIFPDHGSRYMSKIYSDQWMEDQGFLDTDKVDETQEIQYVKG